MADCPAGVPEAAELAIIIALAVAAVDPTAAVYVWLVPVSTAATPWNAPILIVGKHPLSPTVKANV